MGCLEGGKRIDWGAEAELLLSDIAGGDSYRFLDEFQEFLKNLVKAVG